jgi:hypothetical protein
MQDFFRWVHEARATATGRTLATKALGYAANQEHDMSVLRMIPSRAPSRQSQD